MSGRDNPAQGFGESLTGRGEDVVDEVVGRANDRESTGSTGPSGPPVDESTVEDLEGVDPHERLDKENPALPPP